MRKLILSIAFICIMCNGYCQCKYKTKSIEKEIDIIYEMIQNTTAWAKEKDTALLYSIIADDPRYLEIHPGNKVVKGIKQFKEAEKTWLDPRFKHIGFETSDMHINISQDGNVAWFYCMLNDINEWDGKPAAWENTRWTGVLEKRNGTWKMVQMHFSFAH